jgi:molecular chaperone GrpE (heat shock protein)
LRDTTKKHHKASSTTTAVDLEEQMERLQAEIKELSYGLKGKREDAAKFGQRKVWDSYEEASLPCLST